MEKSADHTDPITIDEVLKWVNSHKDGGFDPAIEAKIRADIESGQGQIEKLVLAGDDIERLFDTRKPTMPKNNLVAWLEENEHLCNGPLSDGAKQALLAARRDIASRRFDHQKVPPGRADEADREAPNASRENFRKGRGDRDPDGQGRG